MESNFEKKKHLKKNERVYLQVFDREEEALSASVQLKAVMWRKNNFPKRTKS